MLGAAPATTAGGVRLSPFQITHPCLLSHLSPRQGCSGQPENNGSKKGSSTSLKWGPSPPFSVPAESRTWSALPGSREDAKVTHSSECTRHVSYFCTVTSAWLLVRQHQHRQLSGAPSTFGHVQGAFCPRCCPVQFHAVQWGRPADNMTEQTSTMRQGRPQPCTHRGSFPTFLC